MCAALFLGTALLFSPVAEFGFLNYDDPGYVIANPYVQGGLSWSGLRWAFFSPADYWHPLPWLSHMLDWQLFGPSAGGHHLTSVLWHALNAVLAFLVFRRLAGGFWRSAFAAALFAWHPLRVESVAWVTERKDVMSGCFFLLTLLAYARYAADREAGRPARRSYLLVLAAFAAGLMSKPMLVTLPLLLLVLDFWPFGRGPHPRAARRLLIEKLPLFALSGAVAAATVLMQHKEGAFVLDLPLGARAGNALVSAARYLGKFAWPSDLIVCYPHLGYWPAPALVAAGGLLLGLAWLAWRQRRARPWIAVGLGWYVVTLLPVSGLVQVGFQSMADRYTYLALLGVELALFWSIPAAGSRLGRIAAAAGAAALLATCAACTWAQTGFWRDSVSLFSHAVEASDRNDLAEDFLASALFDAGRFEEAEAHARRAHALNPRNDRALVVLAGLSERKGDADQAVALYRSALALRSDNPQVRCQLGLLEWSRGRAAEARELLAAALRSDEALRSRALEIAESALQRGDAAGARFLFETVLAVAPDDARAHAGAGAVLLMRNDPAGALGHLEAAARKEPSLAEAQLMLSRCAAQLGRTQQAASALEGAVAAARGNPVILGAAAEIHANRREFAAAARLYRKVVELEPDNSRAHAALGYMLILTEDRAGGIAEWRRALELDPGIPGLREKLRQVEH